MNDQEFATESAVGLSGRTSDSDSSGGATESKTGVSPASVAVGLVPWALFSVMTHRLGTSAAGYAALTAVVLGLVLIWRKRASGTGLNIIDVTGVITFSLLAILSFAGGATVEVWVADFGRAGAAFVLAIVMLVSVFFVPFTEQFARQSVPREHWGSPVFRAVNRKISAAWGVAILIMSAGHAVAGLVEPTTATRPGVRPVDLVLNWVLPIVLILATVSYGNRVAAAAGQHPLAGDPLEHQARRTTAD